MATLGNRRTARPRARRAASPIACALFAALLVTAACSRDEAPAPAPAPAAPPAAQQAPKGEMPVAESPAPAAGEEAKAPPGAMPKASQGQDPEVLAEALNNLRSSDAEERADAVLDIEPEGVGLRTLVDTLRDPDPEVRLAVISQLEDGESPEAVAGIVGALQDSDPEVVLEAIDALEFVGDENVLADLRRLLEHPNPEVREAAQDAIEYLEED
jgi:HEAT repeat protein